jgi:hypothetical protein
MSTCQVWYDRYLIFCYVDKSLQNMYWNKYSKISLHYIKVLGADDNTVVCQTNTIRIKP